MAQKIIKIGSSAGVTLSPGTLDAVNMRIKDAIEVTTHPASRTITIRPQRAKGDVNPDVVAWTNVFIEKNRVLLKQLADK